MSALLSSRFINRALAVGAVALLIGCQGDSSIVSPSDPSFNRSGSSYGSDHDHDHDDDDDKNKDKDHDDHDYNSCDCSTGSDYTPGSSQVVVPIGDVGTFTNNVNPDNSGRVLTEFWDNPSADNNGANTSCNVGFFATGTLGSNCLFVAPRSNTNAGGDYTKYFGDGPKDRDAAGFMFNGDYKYTVTLKGSYAGGMSEVGWFTKNNGVYALHPIDAWSNKVINTSLVIDTDGLNWGFYIKNEVNRTGSGCVGAFTHCSDATGGFTVVPMQQFVLMLNPITKTYLVGAEDNRLNLNLPVEDSDYNDYMWSVVPSKRKPPCDFITYGKLVKDYAGKNVVVSGNAGGNMPGSGIMGEFHIEVNGVDYHVSDIDSYRPITSGALAGLLNARLVTGIAKNGKPVELRLYDGGEPGKNTDKVYVKINGTEYLGAGGQWIDQGNMQYHNSCRGPKD
jgi:hypothetical protein